MSSSSAFGGHSSAAYGAGAPRPAGNAAGHCFRRGPGGAVDSGLDCVVLAARLLGLPVDKAQIRHQAGHDDFFDQADVLAALKTMEIHIKRHPIEGRPQSFRWWKSADSHPLSMIDLPAIVPLEDGRFVLAVRQDKQRLLIADPTRGNASWVDSDTLVAQASDHFFHMSRCGFKRDEDRPFDIRWFTDAIKPYRRLLTDVLVAAFFLQLFALATPLFFQVIVDKVLVHQELTTLNILIIGLMVIGLFEAVLSSLRTFIFSNVASRLDALLGARLYRHLLKLPLDYFQSRRLGETLARVQEVDKFREFLTGSALTLVTDLFFLFVFITVLILISPLLSLVVIASLPIYAVLAFALAPTLKGRLEESCRRSTESQAFLAESVAGIDAIKSLAVEPQFRAGWDRKLAALIRSRLRSITIGAVASQLAQALSKITVALILFFGAHLVMSGDLSLGGLVAFFMLAGRVNQPALNLLQLLQEIQRARVSVANLGDLLNTPHEQTGPAFSSSLSKLEGMVTFKQVRFRYRADGPDVLEDISLEAFPGETIGIVGDSGSGKSTVTKLIQRLYVPTSGRVMIDGTDLALLDPSQLRRQIGVVLRENYLFARSVRENIALHNPGASIESITHAAKLAGAHEFIMSLSQGYDTKVEERGTNLSGGQRQCIAIARALLANPRILIFDEAISALDHESEQALHDNMAAIRSNRTVFIIAHRLSTVRGVDRIIVLDKGRVLETGTHNELLEAGGRYALMHAAQHPKPPRPQVTEPYQEKRRVRLRSTA